MKTTKTVVVINETHTVFPQQAEILGEFIRYDLPEEGATLKQVTEEIAPTLTEMSKKGYKIVFITPFAALMVVLAKRGVKFSCLHNDRRIAREIPNGRGGVRVVRVVAPDGWVLVDGNERGEKWK